MLMCRIDLIVKYGLFALGKKEEEIPHLEEDISHLQYADVF